MGAQSDPIPKGIDFTNEKRFPKELFHGKTPVYRYRKFFPHYFNEWDVEIAMWRENLGDKGKWYHFSRAAQLIFPNRIWHDWSIARMQALCKHDFVGWTGCASSGKTDDAAFYAMMFWLANPLGSTVVLTSTTGKMIRKRMWPAITRIKKEYEETWGRGSFPGKVIDTFTTIRVIDPRDPKRVDDRHAIFAKPVAGGETAKARSDIQGIHPDDGRMLLVVDEATDTPEAIFSVIPNLMSQCVTFQCITIGNALSRLDPHGQFCEPIDGWNTVDVDDFEWETTIKDDGKPGICQHFDSLQSPNWLNTEINNPYPFLILRERIAGRLAKPGVEDTPEYWTYDRGFWAPAGLSNTVMNEPMIMRNDAHGKKWTFSTNNNAIVGGLDPAFGGGDRPVLTFAKVGMTEDGTMGIQLMDPIELQIKARESAHETLAKQAKELCLEAGCAPEDLSVDATAEGSGLCEMINRTWAPVHRVQFGSSADPERPVSYLDTRPEKEVYLNKVTAMWFRVRQFVESKQLRGMHKEAIKDFCARKVVLKAGDKKILEPKGDMKEGSRRSPDYGDSLALCVESAKRLGIDLETKHDATDGKKQWWEAQHELDQETDLMPGEELEDELVLQEEIMNLV